MYQFIYTYVYVCVYTYIYIYIYTHTYIYTYSFNVFMWALPPGGRECRQLARRAPAVLLKNPIWEKWAQALGTLNLLGAFWHRSEQCL